MKKIYFLVIALCVFNGLNAQIVTIPDANFKAKLLAASSTNQIAKNLSGVYFKIDANNDNQIQLSEALNVSHLDVNSSNTNNTIYKILDLTGIQSFINLKVLKCNSNQLSSLAVSSLLNLTSLDCSYNKLSSLDVSSLVKLTSLDCSYNQLSSLSVLSLVNLTTLYCSGNQLNSLDVSLLVNLYSLNCSYNQLSSLAVSSLVNLNSLDCLNNQISTLDVSKLLNLKSFSCSNNQISSLDVSKLTNLESFQCSNNQILSLDVSKLEKLVGFYCSKNLLSTLDVSRLSNLVEFSCGTNHLESLFIKNGNSNYIDFSNNPNLKFICVDEAELLAIQTKVNSYGYTNCSVNTYCSFVPGGTFYTIQGNQKFDSNTNGCDVLDVAIPNLKFNITNGTLKGSFISNTLGSYSIPVLAGMQTITAVIENPTYFNVSPTSATVTFPTQASPFMQDFCFTAIGVHPDLEVALLPLQPARPGIDATYKLIYKNKGTNTQSGSVKLMFDDALLDFVKASPITTNQIINNLTWSFTNLLPFETREIEVTLNLNSPVETPSVKGGDILHYTATVTSSETDETPIDNISILNQTVVNSYDPNDKTCLEGDIITPSLIGKEVHYMIRFENKGTANAQNIIVKDLIDLTKFDINSLIPVKASHPFVTTISRGNKVEFIFENINLPFDDANNDGYIAFKIKTLPTLVIGDSFTNEVNIYFDYNFPILTNKAISTFKTLGTSDFKFSNYISLYPNPANSILNISAKNDIEIQSIAVYDILGRLVIAIPKTQKVFTVDVSDLKSGSYFVKINSDKGTSNTKFIKN